MKNIYYIIWADSILRIKKYHPDRKDWKIVVFILITWIHSLNFWIFVLWLKFFNILLIPLLKIDIFPGKLLNPIFAFTIEFALPIGLLNYFLVFHKDRYKRIIVKYPNPNKWYLLIYSYSIIVGAFISAIFYKILK